MVFFFQFPILLVFGSLISEFLQFAGRPGSYQSTSEKEEQKISA